VRERCIFTTHTPVAAGHDRFPADLIAFTLKPFAEVMKLSVTDLMGYGDVVPSQHFTMTILALKLSRAANAVSAKHAEISRLMWHELYPSLTVRNVPIGSVTNGIHIQSWATPAAWEFWERHNSHKWKEHLSDPRFWKHVTDPSIVSDEELWALRSELRRELIEFIRRQAVTAQAAGGVGGSEALHNLLSFDALTIGFARRFAPYKRANLIFSNIQRLVELLNDQSRPMQIIFAGKAHPRDGEGKELLHAIVEFSRHPSYRGKIVFLENYDMNIARRLVSGCDVWLNTPRRPLEASGTSGQKIAISGGLNASILDGWWLEGYGKNNGWAIGGRIEEDLSPTEVDQADADSLYDVLANEILPMFHGRDRQGIPRRWIARIRNAMRSLIPVYNTHRMVSEYASKYYFPG
jgi:alpha-glucan phosphorylase-like protein